MSGQPSSKRSLFISIVVMILIVTVIVLLNLADFPALFPADASSQEDVAASEAATIAVERIFSVDYREGKEAWLARICEVSSIAGCELLASGSDAMWEKFQKEKTVVGAARYGMKKLGERAGEQVWKVEITLSGSLPGSDKSEDSAYVLLVNQEEGWKFDRFLLPQEIQLFSDVDEGSK